MSSNKPEPEGQEWQTYPGAHDAVGSDPQAWAEPVEPARPDPKPYADPPDDEAFKAYQSYAQQPQQPDQGYIAPYQQRPQKRSPLQQKYLWIIGGIIAALVITSFARNGGFSFWPIIMFAGIAWWVLNKRKN